MGKILSNSSARDFQEMQQQFKNPGTSSPNSQYRASGSWIMMELVTDLGDDLWSAKAKSYNTTTNAWDDISNGRETDADLPLLVEGGGSAGDIVRAFPSRDTDGDPLWIAVRGGGAGAIWITTDNTGLSFPNGARYDFPGGAATELTEDDTFYIATPWNTRVVAPDNYFGYFYKDGDNWYQPIQQFYVKPGESYPNGAGSGIDDFDCYIDRSDSSLFLGNEASFPAGRKCILDGFDNVNATTNSRSYFNGKVFPARYDTATNIIYLEHPQF